MSPLYERAAEMLVAELRRGLPTDLVENDLAAAGVPIHDPDALAAFTIAQRSEAIVAELTGERPERQRGRPPTSLLEQSVLIAAFRHYERRNLKRTRAMGAAARALATTLDKVDKTVRALERRITVGDELVVAVLAVAERILPLAIEQTEREAAERDRIRCQLRHAAPSPKISPFSAHPAVR